MFPVIMHLDDVLHHVVDKPEFIVKKQPNGFTTISYNLTMNTSFENMHLRECRGITFDQNGEIIYRPLHKGFNLNEGPKSAEDIFDWEHIDVMDKLDGSMIMVALVDGQALCKTNLSFETYQAVNSNRIINTNILFLEFIKFCDTNHVTPVFEYTGPGNRVVVKYDEEKLTLLHMRNIITGDYWSRQQLKSLAERFELNLVKSVSMDLSNKEYRKEFLKKVKSLENQEGIMIQFANGDMTKVKNDWYINLHHCVTFVRERDVARLVLENQVDDYIGFLAQNKEPELLSKVENIKNRVLTSLNDLTNDILESAEIYKSLPKLEAYTRFKSHPHVKFIARVAVGGDVDYIALYTKYYLKDLFSLDQI